jgi:nucleoside-diphosphate-sugar epimerase
MAVYGSATGTVTESSPFSDDLGPYAEAKIAAELFAKQHPNVICLRPGIVYGPGSNWWSDRIARLLVAGRLGNLGAHGAGTCNLVYVDDVAKAALSALQLQDGNDRAFNLANREAISWNNYFAAYANALSLKQVASISSSRLWAELNVLAVPYKLAELVENKHVIKSWHPAPAIRPWLIKLCGHHIVLDSSRATQVLALQWTPLESGLATSAHWFTSGGRI